MSVLEQRYRSAVARAHAIADGHSVVSCDGCGTPRRKDGALVAACEVCCDVFARAYARRHATRGGGS